MEFGALSPTKGMVMVVNEAERDDLREASSGCV